MEKYTPLPAELVRKQLKQILNQPEFVESRTLASFLEFIVLTKLEGNENELDEYIIGVKVLGQPFNFDPIYNTLVKTHASRLRNLLRLYYQGKGNNDAIVISMPRGTYAPI